MRTHGDDRVGGTGPAAAAFIDQEQEAITISSYENQLVPGLLQTENYARAVFRSRVPAFSEDEIYAETQRGSLFVEDPDEVSIMARKYEMLRTQALNPEDTKGLLDRLLGEQ